jgi:histone acetyltransferase (RNA polymerase elongator complex component)
MIIPFFIPHSGCPHQCVFCNQKNITGRSKSVEAPSIPQKITEYLNTNTSKEPVQTAFYGGSFTALPQETQKTYLEAARPFIQSGQIQSIRLSTRPDCITEEILTLLKEYRVDTVELGVQSMDDRVLTRSGRGHTVADTVNAVTLLREFGFTIGLQLMPGLPGDSTDTFMNTVDRAIVLKPDFVRIYPALVLRETPLEELYKSGRYAPLSLDEAVSLCRDALLRFEQADIDVIRIGLQSTEELEKPGTILAGPYHPAFRQIVESSISLGKMREILLNHKKENDSVIFLVNPGDISAAVGQKRSNIEILKKEFGLHTINIVQDPTIPKKEVHGA